MPTSIFRGGYADDEEDGDRRTAKNLAYQKEREEMLAHQKELEKRWAAKWAAEAKEQARLAEKKRLVYDKRHQLRRILYLEEKRKKGPLNAEDDRELKEYRSNWPESEFPIERIKQIEIANKELYEEKDEKYWWPGSEAEPYENEYFHYLREKYAPDPEPWERNRLYQLRAWRSKHGQLMPHEQELYEKLSAKYPTVLGRIGKIFRGGIRKTNGKGKSKRRQTRRNYP